MPHIRANAIFIRDLNKFANAGQKVVRGQTPGQEAHGAWLEIQMDCQ
jgi:hypothetical protein